MQSLKHGVLILDYGSQYTLLIARRIREQNVYCEIWPCNDPRISLALENNSFSAKAIILSGGPNSVAVENSPDLNGGILSLNIPILGICYGMQLLAEAFGAKIKSSEGGEYGRTKIQFSHTAKLFADISKQNHTTVWMSHGDEVANTPENFTVTAQSENGVIAALEHNSRALFAVQFHPEVAHTKAGNAILNNFLFKIANCTPNWNMESFVPRAIKEIRTKVGEKHVICGLSGGVDSSVVAALLAKAIGSQLTCIFVDNGLLRKNERAIVEENFAKHFNVKLIVVDARKRFLQALAGITDPEQKRKIIGEIFIRVFEDASNEITSDKEVAFLAQGTLYPDVIESISIRGPSATIKSHHNVGGLPEDMKFALIEPLRELFKDEVRELGRELGLPNSLVMRHPFPGPGLAVRIIGEINEERLAVLREADHVFIQGLLDDNLYHDVWQAFAVLIPIKTVGVMGDSRTYEWLCALRAVSSTDGMTADRSHLPHEFLGRISDKIINSIPRINRVVYDISSKPPSTIEWE